MSPARAAPAMAAALLGACAQPPAREAQPSPVAVEAPAVVLNNAGFEEEFTDGRNCPPQWICRVHVDRHSFRITSGTPATGRGGLLIERVGPEPWATVAQVVAPGTVRDRRLRFTLSMKTEKIVGPGGGPFILVRGPASYLEHRVDLRTGTSDWQRVTIEVEVPPGADHVEVGAMLEAQGRLWIDDARVEVLPNAKR